MTTPSPEPRRIVRPRWFDPRLILGVGLVLFSTLAGARLLAASDHRVPVLALRHDLQPGTVLAATDVTVVRVQLAAEQLHDYLASADLAQGRVLAVAARAGELLPVSALDTAPPATVVVIPLPSGSAPNLSAGDRIEVWVSSKTCRTRVLLDDVTVQAVHADGSSGFSAQSGQGVVVNLVPELADRVVTALALDGASLRAGRITGPPGRRSADLPALTDCAGSTQ